MCVQATAQFAPQAGLAGSTAIHASDSRFVGWGTTCTVARGYMDIADKGLGYTSAGESGLALGQADGTVVSLGDSGVAVFTFAHALFNGAGADFAVFENGFRDPADSAQGFLELAFVEVSSDGVNYFRFPAASNTPVNVQIPLAGVYMDARKVNNLAGKYLAMYGTPFDLTELAGTPGLNVNNITHVRVVDVVGAVSGYSTHDNAGNVINDPYPSAIPTGGFDLDAIGAIHMYAVGVDNVAGAAGVGIRIYPNPVTDKVVISMEHEGAQITVASVTGAVLQQQLVGYGDNVVDMAAYPAGLYFLTIQEANGNKWVEKLLKR